jgi:hypothetical protein
MKKNTRRILIVILSILVISVGAFLLYTSDYYRANADVMLIMDNSGSVVSESNTITLTPSIETNTGIIFYPGAKVEYTSYLPLLQKLQQRGYLCVLVQMPFNLAILNVNAADGVISEYPEIEHWYLAGHSLGGAMASSYLSGHPDGADGLILLGAYVYGNVPVDNTLVLYGSEDKVLDRSKLSGGNNEVVIKGGNHAQFGNYGTQAGDGTATISAEEQQDITVEKIDDFIK